MIYTVCGINIESAISLAGIFPLSLEDRIDAVIKFAAADDGLADGLPLGLSYNESRKQLIATHPSAGSFSIVGGKEIVVRAKAGRPEAELADVLATTPLAALLLQRGLVTLHASAIETDRGAIVFMGPTAAGKSCLAACFRQKGCRVLADDMTVLSKDTNGGIGVMSGDGRLKLSRDAARNWKAVAGPFVPLRRGVRKQMLAGAMTGVVKKTTLYKIYLLESTNRNEVVFSNLDEKRRMQTFLGNTYQTGLLARMGLGPAYMNCLMHTLSTVPLSIISIPRSFGQIALAVEQLIGQFSLSPNP